MQELLPVLLVISEHFLQQLLFVGLNVTPLILHLVPRQESGKRSGLFRHIQRCEACLNRSSGEILLELHSILPDSATLNTVSDRPI